MLKSSKVLLVLKVSPLENVFKMLVHKFRVSVFSCCLFHLSTNFKLKVAVKQLKSMA